MNNIIILSDIECEMGAIVGMKRHIESKTRKRPDKFMSDKTDQWQIDIDGAIAEMAYCRFRDVYWTASINTFKGADVGKVTQIRHTNYDGGHLVIRERDDDSHYYVLVVGVMPQYRIVGWMLGKDGKQDFWLKNPGDTEPPYWWVPQESLHLFSK